MKLHQFLNLYSTLAEQIQRRVHVMMLMTVWFSPGVQMLIYMYPLTVYNHMDAGIMCCD